MAFSEPKFHSSLDYIISYMYSKGWGVTEINQGTSNTFSFPLTITFVNHILIAKTEIRNIVQYQLITQEQIEEWSNICEQAIQNWSSLL